MLAIGWVDCSRIEGMEVKDGVIGISINDDLVTVEGGGKLEDNMLDTVAEVVMVVALIRFILA